jgi:hypothetical protein
MTTAFTRSQCEQFPENHKTLEMEGARGEFSKLHSAGGTLGPREGLGSLWPPAFPSPLFQKAR